MNSFLMLCHPEPFSSLKDKLREASQRCRYYNNASVDYLPTALRFFALLRFAQNDKQWQYAQNDNKANRTICHPERSEGSQRQRFSLDVRILFIPVIAEVNPCRIDCFYQLDLLFSQPTLDGLFSGYGRSDVTERFIIDELVNVVLLSKTFDEFILMLMHSANNIVGQTDVERAGSVCQDVHEVLMVSIHGLYCNVKSYPMPDSSVAPQNDKWGPESFIASVDRFREEKLILCHSERSEGSRRYRCFSNALVFYTPVALRFFASLRSAQNDKLGCFVQNDKIIRRQAWNLQED
jgi:hypothetical protein